MTEPKFKIGDVVVYKILHKKFIAKIIEITNLNDGDLYYLGGGNYREKKNFRLATPEEIKLYVK
jgi:hypothetical protein